MRNFIRIIGYLTMFLLTCSVIWHIIQTRFCMICVIFALSSLCFPLCCADPLKRLKLLSLFALLPGIKYALCCLFVDYLCEAFDPLMLPAFLTVAVSVCPIVVHVEGGEAAVSPNRTSKSQSRAIAINGAGGADGALGKPSPRTQRRNVQVVKWSHHRWWRYSLIFVPILCQLSVLFVRMSRTSKLSPSTAKNFWAVQWSHHHECVACRATTHFSLRVGVLHFSQRFQLATFTCFSENCLEHISNSWVMSTLTEKRTDTKSGSGGKVGSGEEKNWDTHFCPLTWPILSVQERNWTETRAICWVLVMWKCLRAPP